MPDAEAIVMSDATPKSGPALSATSDAPVIDITANTIPADDAPAEKPAKEAAADDGAGDDDATAKPAKEDKTDPAIKAAITKEKNRRRAAEETAAQERARADSLAKTLESLTKKADPEPPTERPRRADFSDPDAYETALETYVAEKTRAETVKAEREREQLETVKRTVDATIKGFSDQVKEFKETHPDFDEVFTDDLDVTLAMSNAIMVAENGAQIAYWLGQNPNEATRIAEMPDVKAVYELGRIAARLAEPAARKAPTKPAPIRALKGNSAAGDYGDEPSMEEYAARRKAQLTTGGPGAVH